MSAAEDTAETATPGLLLRMARRESGLGLEDAARQANLTLTLARALEQDAYAELGLPVYARGYYRRYAKVVGCDAAPVLAAYERINDLPSPVPTVHQRPSIPYAARGSWQRFLPWVVGGAALLIIAVGLLDRRTDDSEPTLPRTLPSLDVDPVDWEPSPPPTATPAPTALPNISAARNPTTVDLSAPQADEASGAAPSPADEGPEPAGGAVAPNLLEIRVGEVPAWIEVDDATAERLAYRVAQPGETLRLAGEPPYRINLGRAHTLEVRLGGRLLALGEAIDSKARARGTLTEDGRLLPP